MTRSLPFLSIISAIACITVTNQATAKQTISNGVTLEAGYYHIARTIDGSKDTVRYGFPLGLKTVKNHKHVYVFGGNGWRLRKLSQNGYVSSANIKIGSKLKNKKNQLDSSSILAASPSDNTLWQFSPNLQPSLYAGKDRRNSKRTKSTTHTQLLTDAEFNRPIQVDRIGKKDALVLDDSGKSLRLIKDSTTITTLKTPSWLFKDTELKGFKIANDDTVWAFNENNIYQFALNEKYTKLTLLQHWGNNTEHSFGNIEGIAIDGQTTLAIDSKAGTIVELLPYNKVNVKYQSPCSDAIMQKNNYTCLATNNKLPVNTSFSGIVKNPWSKGFLISDWANHVIYQYDNGKLSVYSGTFNKVRTLNSKETSAFVGACENLTIVNNTKYCISSTASYKLNKNKPQLLPISGIEGIAPTVANNVLYVFEKDSLKTFNLKNGNTHYLGGKKTAGFKDGNIATAQFAQPKGLVYGGDKQFYIADTENYRLRKINKNGVVSTVHKFSSSANNPYVGKPAFIARNGIYHRIVDEAGSVYRINVNSQKLDKLYSTSLKYGLDSAAVDTKGNVWVVSNNEDIFKFNARGKHTAVLQNTQGNTSDFVSMRGITNKPLPPIKSIAFDKHNNLWLGTETGLFKISASRIKSYLGSK